MLNLRIARLAHDGRGIGFLPDGKAVFVSNGLPGQRVACEIINAKKKYSEAALVEVLESPPGFSVPHCSHYQECGGCPLQQMPYANQLFWKQTLARDAFLRIGGMTGLQFDAIWQNLAPAPQLRGFRNKIEMAFGSDADGDLALGFRARASASIFALHDCVLFEDSAVPIILQCRALAASSNLPAYRGSGFWRSLILRQARTNSVLRWHALLITNGGSSEQRQIVLKLGQKLLSDLPQLGSFVHEERYHNDSLAKGEKRITTLGDPNLAMELGGRCFSIDPAAFFQVNSKASEILVSILKGMDKCSGPLLDLYCGVGAPGQLLADKHDSCLGLELDAAAVAKARQNAACLHNWRYEAGDAAKRLAPLARKLKKWPLVLLDPPRAGLSSRALEAIMKLEPDNILYVSCNPPTMARDARALARGYSLKALAGVDMFPHTPHLECVGLWQKQS